ncbi:MAG: hypothetical protein HYV40_05795 [Candidatus Levybacteria bacterium]|nr:hypothetical protein [Candidatus Levybacteria bacterium]
MQEKTAELLRDNAWPTDYVALASAWERIDPELADRIQRFADQRYPLYGTQLTINEAVEIVKQGSYIEAANLTRKALIHASWNYYDTYPPIGIRNEFERVLVEVAKTDPQRVLNLIDDTYPDEKDESLSQDDLKIIVFTEGAIALVKQDAFVQARNLLERAVVLARSLEITEPEDSQRTTAIQHIGQEVQPDHHLLRRKAITLARVAGAVAKFEGASGSSL